MKWDEQVRLESGEVVVVARTAKYTENWVAGGGGGSVNEGMTLRFVQPANADSPTEWSARYVPIVMDRDPETGEWFIVATFFHCDSWYALGRPPLPYTEYRFRGGNWVQLPLTPKWIGRQTNILPADLSNKAEISKAPLLSVEHKSSMLSDPAISKKYKQVVGKWSTGC